MPTGRVKMPPGRLGRELWLDKDTLNSIYQLIAAVDMANSQPPGRRIPALTVAKDLIPDLERALATIRSQNGDPAHVHEFALQTGEDTVKAKIQENVRKELIGELNNAVHDAKGLLDSYASGAALPSEHTHEDEEDESDEEPIIIKKERNDVTHNKRDREEMLDGMVDEKLQEIKDLRKKLRKIK